MSLRAEKPQSFPESSIETSEQLKALIRNHQTTRAEDASSPDQSTYHVLCCLCIVTNLTIAGCMIIGQDVTDLEGLRKNSTIALSADFCACIAIRNEHIINAIIGAASSLPHCAPLSIRKAAARIYCHGGIHSGCAISGAIWYLVSICLWLLDPQKAPDIRKAVSFLSGIAMLLLTAMLIFAHPSLRAKHHNVFELTHRLLGWTFVATLWLQIILEAAADSAIHSRMLGQQLLINAPFWLLVVSTLLLIYPWIHLRSISVDASNVSNHVLRLTVHQEGEKSCMTRRLATTPLRETHAFATIPGQDGTTYSIYISAAGDWTRSLIANPPRRIWVKGYPTFGATRSSRLFRKVLFVATGSGIAPVLSAVLSRRVNEVAVLWITSDPRKKLEIEQLQELEVYGDNVIICNTGRDQMTPSEVAAISHELHRAHRSEAVFVISNAEVTKIVKADLERRGVPVFGPIFDS